jgi:cell division protein FtsB
MTDRELLRRIPVLEEKLDRVLSALDQIIENQSVDGIVGEDGVIVFDSQQYERHKEMRRQLEERERQMEELKRKSDELRRELGDV